MGSMRRSRSVAESWSFRRFRSPELALPLTFWVSLSDDMPASELTSRLLALRRALAGASDLMALRAGDPGPDRPYIRIGASASTVALADVASVTLDHDDGQPDLDVAGANLGCAAAVLLTGVGQPNIAAQLAAVCAADSTVISGLHAAFTLAGAFYRSRRIPEALELIAALRRHGDFDSRAAAFILTSAVLARGTHMTDDEARQAADVARVGLDASLASGDANAAAADSYSLGKMLSHLGQWSDAAAAFELAAELDPGYDTRPYFHADLGAALFESGRYDEAAARYERALELGGDRWSLALRADSLMFAGRYAQAQDVFAEYLAGRSESPRDGVWRLKHRVLDDLRALVGDQQDRRPDEALELARSVDFENPAITVEHAWATVGQALEADGCCGVAHNRRMFVSFGMGENGEPDATGALEPAISSALLDRGDPAVWLNAVMIAAAAGEPDSVLYDLMRTGVRSAGQEVVDSILSAESPLIGETQLVLLDRGVEDLARERRGEGFVLRMAVGDEVLELPFAPPKED
jgi:tetratricopeptide (TPR) repeat protein